MDLSGTPLEFQSRHHISKKHQIGELTNCYVCRTGVGVERAVKCLLCERYHHKRCLTAKGKGDTRCISCQGLTKASLSPNPEDLSEVLNQSAVKVIGGLEQEESDDQLSQKSGKLARGASKSGEWSDEQLKEEEAPHKMTSEPDMNVLFCSVLFCSMFL